MFEKITEAEINERSMANVSTTPNRPTAFGESRMDAQALKLRFDRLSRYLAGRLNEIFTALDEGNFAQAVYINHEGRKVNLETFITNLLTGNVDDIQIQTVNGIIYLTELGNKVQEIYNGQHTGDLAGNITIVDGVTLKKFYEDFLNMEDQGQGEPGKSAYDYAVEGGYQGTEEEFAKKLATEYPSKVSQLENDEKYITALGAPVQNVNGKTGNVSLSAADVGARPNTWTPTAYEVGAEPVNTVNTHNASDQAHNDIRIELRNLASRINDLLDSDDENLNELHEIVEYIKNNHTLISNITTSKVSVVDIVNDLVTALPDKPLSAAQGVALKALIDAITVPTKLSQLENDKGYITGYTESDPTVPEWAKAAKKPGYTKEEVGLSNVENVKQYSASNPPPYPVKSVNNKTGNVTLTAGDVGARPSTWTPTATEVGAEKAGNVAAHNTNTAAHNDIRLLIEGLSNRINAIFDSEDTDLDELSEIVAYIKSNKDLIDAITTSKVSVTDIIDNLETSDPKKPLSAKQGVVLKALIDAITVPTKLSQLENDKKFITKSEAPVQTVNNKTGNVELNADDVGARPDTWTPSASEVGARPDDWMPTAADVGARPNSWTPTASDVGARPATWTPTYSDVGAEKAGNVDTHNTNAAAHSDIRLLITALSDRINAVLDSDDTTLDELSEIVAYIKANKALIESVTTNKVNVADIIDNLETPDPKKPLSANQGVVLMGWLNQLVTEFGAALEGKANKSEGVFYIKGGGTTDATNKVATWTGTHEGITEYYDGLMIAYKIGTAGSTTTTLNINDLGAVPVVKNATSAISTSFAEKSVIFLVYTTDSGTAYWKAHDYDTNTKTTTGTSNKTGTKLFLVGGASQASSATTYSNSNVFIDTSNVLNSAQGFKGDLTGNADTATKATQDASGNVIAETYVKNSQLSPSISNALEAARDEITNDVVDKVPLVKTPETPPFATSIAEMTDTTKAYVLDDPTSEDNGYMYTNKYVKTTVNSGENILPDCEPFSDLTAYKTGLYYGRYASTSAGGYSADTNCTITAKIPYTYTNHPILYIKGVNWDASSSHSRIATWVDTTSKAGVTFNLNALSSSGLEVTELDTNYYKVECVDPDAATLFFYDSGLEIGVTHIYFSFDNVAGTEDIQISYEEFKNEVIEGYQWVRSNLKYYAPDDYEDEIVDHENRLNIVEEIVDELAVSGNGTLTYVAEEAARVAEIVQAKRTVGSLTFTAMSDTHIEVDTTNIYGLKNNLTSCRDAGLGLAELQKHFKLDFAAMLGDYTWADSSETVEQVKKDLTYAKKCMTEGMKGIPNIWCTGNHDINYGKDSDRRMTEDELYAYLTSNNKGTIQDGDNIGRNYGYIDFENQKIRCIYLNTVDALDYPDNAGTADDASEVTAIQAQWLVDVGLNLTDKKEPTKWGIVLLSHHCISIFQPITTILTAYKNGTSASVNISTNGVTTTVNYNFSSVSRGEIICAVHGHNHNFIAKKISSEPYNAITEANAWLWSICVPNMDTTRDNEAATSTDTAWKNAFGEFDSSGNPVYYPKTQGTATSTSFCVITIDRKNRKVHAIAYGAGAVDADREIDY